MLHILGIAVGIVGIVIFNPVVTLLGIGLSFAYIINNYAEEEK